jgi:hypothetical protein
MSGVIGNFARRMKLLYRPIDEFKAFEVAKMPSRNSRAIICDKAAAAGAHIVLQDFVLVGFIRGPR